MTTTATASRTSRASFSARARPSTTTGDPGDHVAAALAAAKQGAGAPVVAAGLARRGVVDRVADQLQGPVALGVAQVGPQAQDDLRRVAVGEEVGEARLGRARGRGRGRRRRRR